MGLVQYKDEVEEDSLRRRPERPTIELAVKNVTAPIENARDMIAALGKVMAGLCDGTVKADQANAICNVSGQMLRCLEVGHRIRRERRQDRKGLANVESFEAKRAKAIEESQREKIA